MGTDSVKLFNKALADQILGMDQEALVLFLESNIDVLKQKAFSLSPIVFDLEQNGGSVSDAFERLLHEQTITQVTADLAQNFGFADEEIYLDYWGCYAHLFVGGPEGSISSLDYLPDQEEEVFLLLRPDHVAEMIKSLREHANDLRILSEESIS